MKTITYKTTGTCSRFIELSGDNGVITDVKFYGGCDGNLQDISSLVKGMRYEDVISRLKGISCNGKPTSCPDQLCRAIEILMAEDQLSYYVFLSFNTLVPFSLFDPFYPNSYGKNQELRLQAEERSVHGSIAQRRGRIP